MRINPKTFQGKSLPTRSLLAKQGSGLLPPTLEVIPQNLAETWFYHSPRRTNKDDGSEAATCLLGPSPLAECRVTRGREAEGKALPQPHVNRKKARSHWGLAVSQPQRPAAGLTTPPIRSEHLPGLLHRHLHMCEQEL